MDHHGMDGGAAAPERAGAGPGGAARGSGGPMAGNRVGGAVAGRVRPDAAAGFGGGGAGSAADRVWAVLLFSSDPLDWYELAKVTEVTLTAALEALVAFENGGYVLRIPAVRRGSWPHPDLWVLAGGVRERQKVADAVCARLLAQLADTSADPDGWSRNVWRFALEAGVLAPPVAIGPVTELPVLPKGGLKPLVLEQLVQSFPESLSVVAIGKRLGGRSSGAVRSAADRLCAERRAVCTDPQVRKYAASRPDGSALEPPGEHENLA
jgi:hypothetical protein